MILISHRGNIDGPNKEKENSPEYILAACNAGYDVEIDVWFENNEFYLGHDEPTYKTNLQFLKNPKFWCHAKNLSALDEMIKHQDIHCFWHQTDDVILTSNKFFWVYPGKEILSYKSIAVVPEKISFDWDISKAYGVCSDYLSRYK